MTSPGDWENSNSTDGLAHKLANFTQLKLSLGRFTFGRYLNAPILAFKDRFAYDRRPIEYAFDECLIAFLPPTLYRMHHGLQLPRYDS